MLRSFAPLNLKVGPKDTATGLYVKQVTSENRPNAPKPTASHGFPLQSMPKSV
jgi:hypothetical protein